MSTDFVFYFFEVNIESVLVTQCTNIFYGNKTQSRGIYVYKINVYFSVFDFYVNKSEQKPRKFFMY